MKTHSTDDDSTQLCTCPAARRRCRLLQPVVQPRMAVAFAKCKCDYVPQQTISRVRAIREAPSGKSHQTIINRLTDMIEYDSLSLSLSLFVRVHLFARSRCTIDAHDDDDDDGAAR